MSETNQWYQDAVIYQIHVRAFQETPWATCEG